MLNTSAFCTIHKPREYGSFPIVLCADIISNVQIFYFFALHSNMWWCRHSTVLKAPGVKKFLGVPEITVAPPASTSEKPSLSFLETLKKFAAAQQAASSPGEPSKPAADQRIPSSSVISQRLRSLEKQVKGRKKNKKRWGDIFTYKLSWLPNNIAYVNKCILKMAFD